MFLTFECSGTYIPFIGKILLIYFIYNLMYIPYINPLVIKRNTKRDCIEHRIYQRSQIKHPPEVDYNRQLTDLVQESFSQGEMF